MNFFRNTDGTWGRDILLIAALFLGDMSVRVGFADRVGAICNPSGPWGVEIAGHFLTVSSVVLVIVIIVLLNRAHTEFMRIGLLLILAGGIGNIFDRMLFGCVRDYVVVPWFPALNPADVMLTFGSLAVVYAIVREKV